MVKTGSLFLNFLQFPDFRPVSGETLERLVEIQPFGWRSARTPCFKFSLKQSFSIHFYSFI